MSYATALHTYRDGRCIDCHEPIPEVPIRIQAAHGGLVHDVDQSRSSRSWVVAACSERVATYKVSDQLPTCVACASLARRRRVVAPEGEKARQRTRSEAFEIVAWGLGLALLVLGLVASSPLAVALGWWAFASTLGFDVVHQLLGRWRGWNLKRLGWYSLAFTTASAFVAVHLALKDWSGV